MYKLFMSPPVLHAMTLLSSQLIQKDPWVLVDVIAKALGFVLNLIYNMVYTVTVSHSLGFSIIVLTIFTRALMLPLAFQSQKSMAAMQRLQPEIDKLKKKYDGNKDPEAQKKMNVEMQNLYAKNKINPLGGCLPMLIQLPIFLALSFIMQNSYRYITKIGDVYNNLAQTILPEISSSDKPIELYALMRDIILPKVPDKLLPFDFFDISNLEKALNKFSAADWGQVLATFPSEVTSQLQGFLSQKESIEYFFGMNLIENAGTAFPGILIPILSAVTTFLSSYLMNRQNKNADSNAKMQQKIMLIVMPVMMGFMTISFPAGVGIYWITSSVFQLFQQILLNRYYGRNKENTNDSGKNDKGSGKISIGEKSKKGDVSHAKH